MFSFGSLVAIPPYCSGQFQGPAPIRITGWCRCVCRNPTVLLRAIPSGLLVLLLLVGPQKGRNPTVLLRAIPSWRGLPTLPPSKKSQSHRTAQGNSKLDDHTLTLATGQEVAIPPYCSGQFQALFYPTPDNTVRKVAIPPYCSGQFQDHNSRNLSYLVIIPSQSHRTAQGNSKESVKRCKRNDLEYVAIPPYCSGQFQGLFGIPVPPQTVRLSRNPTVLLRAIPRTTRACSTAPASAVAIPPYCSGQFQGRVAAAPHRETCARRNPTVLLRAIPRKSTDRRCHEAQGKGRNPTVLLRAIPRYPSPTR